MGHKLLLLLGCLLDRARKRFRGEKIIKKKAEQRESTQEVVFILCLDWERAGTSQGWPRSAPRGQPVAGMVRRRRVAAREGDLGVGAPPVRRLRARRARHARDMAARGEDGRRRLAARRANRGR